MNIMISADNMLSLYIGLELQSLCLYIMAAFNRNSLHSSEAGLKYFILGALSSGILLFGVSLIYGFTGSTSFAVIAQTLDAQNGIPMSVIVAMVFILTGLAFKISAVPFHMWTPDVYQGSPASVTAFFAMAPKVAAMALLIRVTYDVFGTIQADWSQIVYALSALSMIVGAFAGLVQKNIYRLLAYSSIGHMGYALMGVIGGTTYGLTATLVYLALYLVMVAGIFALIISVRKDNIAISNISDFAGLSIRSPMIAYGLTAFLFSMSGIPPLAGFFGKLFVFQAALEGGYIILAIIGVLTSVVAAYYYLMLIKVMFFDKASQGDVYEGNLHLTKWIVFPSLIFTLTYILFPNWLVYEAERAALSLY
jgi:NADH-quinone oxidoreductase subunit N